MTDSFSALGVSGEVESALAELGIVEPFAVQRMCIPAAMAGDDVIAKSPTGSGKTLAFGLPLVMRANPERTAPEALVLCPTRELAQQIAADLERGHVFTDRILNRRGRDETLLLGAATMRPIIERLLPGASIVSRPPPASSARQTTSVSAASTGLPRASRSHVTAHNNAESVGASSRVTAAGSRPHTNRAATSGQPATAPLWLNNRRPSRNGAAAARPPPMPLVADRTAASSAPVRTTLARSAHVSSAQIGPASRCRAGSSTPSTYQPIPNPSALTTPCS